MRLLFLALVMISFGCVQIDDGTGGGSKPKPGDSVVVPDDSQNAKVDTVLLEKIIADKSLTKDLCMRYAALFRGFAQSFRERTDIPAMMLLNACFKTADQFIETESKLVTVELQKLKDGEKTRDSLSGEFDRMSETFRAASLKK
jgi:hypothetical protein